MRSLHLPFVLYVVPVKSKVEISQNFVAFSEYMNFTTFLVWKNIGLINVNIKYCFVVGRFQDLRTKILIKYKNLIQISRQNFFFSLHCGRSVCRSDPSHVLCYFKSRSAMQRRQLTCFWLCSSSNSSAIAAELKLGLLTNLGKQHLVLW